MRKQEFIHLFLVKGNSPEDAIKKITNFLEKYELVKYDYFQIERETLLTAKRESFWYEIEKAIGENRRILQKFLGELKKEGYTHWDDILELPQGYLSKIFHLIAHILDGFFSIDSRFYNLIEDSHWISSTLKNEIQKNPHLFYLIKIKGYFKSPVYKFEILKPSKFLKYS